MAKRTGASDLNHDNWDQEDEKEEAGEFKKASDEQLKVIVKRMVGWWFLWCVFKKRYEKCNNKIHLK